MKIEFISQNNIQQRILPTGSYSTLIGQVTQKAFDQLRITSSFAGRLLVLKTDSPTTTSSSGTSSSSSGSSSGGGRDPIDVPVSTGGGDR